MEVSQVEANQSISIDKLEKLRTLFDYAALVGIPSNNLLDAQLKGPQALSETFQTELLSRIPPFDKAAYPLTNLLPQFIFGTKVTLLRHKSEPQFQPLVLPKSGGKRVYGGALLLLEETTQFEIAHRNYRKEANEHVTAKQELRTMADNLRQDYFHEDDRSVSQNLAETGPSNLSNRIYIA